MIRTLLPAFILAFMAAPATAQDARIVERAYEPGTVVRIEGRAKMQATIEFGEDEHIENVAIGDSQAWQVTPNKRASLLFLKPMASAAATNMTVVTDRRTYLFDLVANTRATPLYILRFTYPETAVTSAADQTPAAQQAIADQVPTANPYAIVDPARLHFTWRTAGDKSLLPAQIYDDGQATFLTWPEGRTLPAILVKDRHGVEGPVNFASRDDLIVIDGVPAELVLRSGKASASLINTRAQARPRASIALTAEERTR